MTLGKLRNLIFMKLFSSSLNLYFIGLLQNYKEVIQGTDSWELMLAFWFEMALVAVKFYLEN